MTERNKNIQTEKSPGAVDQAKIESVKKADAAVKSMSDFTSPEVLYQELITSVRNTIRLRIFPRYRKPTR